MAPSPSDRANEKRTILVRRLTKKANEVPCPHCDTREFKYLQSMEKHCWDAHGVRLSREEKETFERRLRAVHAVRAGGAGLGERKKKLSDFPPSSPLALSPHSRRFRSRVARHFLCRRRTRRRVRRRRLRRFFPWASSTTTSTAGSRRRRVSKCCGSSTCSPRRRRVSIRRRRISFCNLRGL